ncbi:MAG: sulfatase [Acidobacteria bacterium]|nr:sulfatase [Acidobacteriota bacterium]
MLRVSRRRLAAPLAAAIGAVRCGVRRLSRPNVLFAIADDQSWPHAGALGSRVVRTPVFDRVAREGVLFTHSFAASPSCTPSRSGILTGRPIWEVGEGGVLYGTLAPKLRLFPHLLADAGYHVGFTGKGWGPGNWQAGGLRRHPNGKEYNRRTFSTPLPKGIDARDSLANFEDFLAERPAGAPFCFWFGSTEPHRPYQAGIGRESGKRLDDAEVPPYWPDVEEVRSDILDYHYEVEWFDRQVGRFLTKLEQIGELDDTLVIVTSDNGMPFPRAKVNLYDPGVRMPLAIRWATRVAGNRTISDLASHTDFAPTILEAAGLRPPGGMAGRSLLPALESGRSGRVEPERDHVVTALERHTWCRPEGATYPVRALRTHELLYIRNFAPDRWPTGGPEFVSSNLTFHGDVDAGPIKMYMESEECRKKYPRQYELCYGKRPAEELYDLTKDPHQVANVALDPAYRAAKGKLWSRLEEYLKRTGDPRIEGRDPWQGYVYRQTTGFGATFNRSLTEEERRQARESAAHKPE